MKILLIALSLPVIVMMTNYSFADSFTAQVEWDETNHHNAIDSFSKKIQVTEHDMNQNQTRVETIPVRIWSDSDNVGITVSSYETGKDTGVFESIIYFSQKNSIGQRIHVEIGDLVTAQYIDGTVPDSETMSISDTFTVKGFSRENDSNFRVDDPDFAIQDLFRGETIPNPFAIQIIKGLGAGLIILFIVIYAVKKRRQK